MKIIHGDAYQEIKKLPDNSVDLIITDPPYLIGTNKDGSVGKFGKCQFMAEINKMSAGFNVSILDDMIAKMKKINIYIFCSQKQIPILIDYFVKKHGCNWNLLTWHKTNPVPACGNKYLNDTEYCFFAREKGVKLLGEYRTKKTYWITPTNVKDKHKYNHPTIKPLYIIEYLIQNSSKPGDVVLDTFMGSGTTGVAAKELDRDFIGFELDDNYYKTAKNRIAQENLKITN